LQLKKRPCRRVCREALKIAAEEMKRAQKTCREVLRETKSAQKMTIKNNAKMRHEQEKRKQAEIERKRNWVETRKIFRIELEKEEAANASGWKEIFVMNGISLSSAT